MGGRTYSDLCVCVVVKIDPPPSGTSCAGPEGKLQASGHDVRDQAISCRIARHSPCKDIESHRVVQDNTCNNFFSLECRYGLRSAESRRMRRWGSRGSPLRISSVCFFGRAKKQTKIPHGILYRAIFSVPP